MDVLLNRSGCAACGHYPELAGHMSIAGVNPCTYLVDILQRLSLHPARDVEELTPRVWREKFADNPLKSDLELI